MVMISDSLFRTMLRVTGSVVVRHPDGQFEAHFDDGTQDADFGDVAIEATEPRLTARTVDVEALAKRTQLDFKDFRGRDVTYFFEKHEPDGTGMSRVIVSL